MVSGFRKKKIDAAERVGEVLRQAREGQHKTLAEAARATQIQEVNLHRLEEGYYQDLPADVYVKGFLRHYAEYLSLSPSKILRCYCQERDIQGHLERQHQPRVSEPRPVYSPLLIPRLIKTGVIVGIVTLAVIYLGLQFKNFSRHPGLILEAPADDVTISDDRVTFVGQADREAILTINGQEVFIGEDGKFQEQVFLQDGLNTVVVLLRDRHGRETSLTRRILVVREEDQGDRESISAR